MYDLNKSFYFTNLKGMDKYRLDKIMEGASVHMLQSLEFLSNNNVSNDKMYFYSDVSLRTFMSEELADFHAEHTENPIIVLGHNAIEGSYRPLYNEDDFNKSLLVLEVRALSLLKYSLGGYNDLPFNGLERDKIYFSSDEDEIDYVNLVSAAKVIADNLDIDYQDIKWNMDDNYFYSDNPRFSSVDQRGQMFAVL